ncbi:MAG TPA: hypothetical protein VMZ52_04375 [Bryobacteraceae bacterium]|nr:hypothetical protein [Bryobacteraceae bacterium]
MPRRCLLALLLCPLLEAAIWPEQIGTLKRAETQNVAAPDPSLWVEFGFVTGEQARFADAARRLTATAWRLKDTTGAFAALQSFGSSLPAGSTRIQEDNYILQFDGGKLSADELKRLANVLPKVDHASLPPLKDAIPARGRIPGSERYILGPVSLERFEPKISPSAAGFHLGAEAQLARYKAKHGDEKLIVFSYPTPQIARERSEVLSQVAGAVVKRSGPLVAVVPSPGDPDAAERLLAMVKYTPIVTWSEPAPKKEANFGDTLQSIVILAAVLIVCSVLLGVFLGGFRVLLARFGISSADNSFTALDIGKK